MRFRQRALAVMSVCFVAVGLAACGSSAASNPTPRPTAVLANVPSGKAFVATLVTDAGGLNDRSFNQMAWDGVKQAQKLQRITGKASVSSGPSDYLSNLTRAAQRYSALTVAVGYGMAQDVYTAAQQYPGARFALVDARPLDANKQETTVRNVQDLLFKEQEAGYLVGVIAGLMEKQRVGKAVHNTIGYVGGQQIPAVDRYLAGYVAGAEHVDPSIKIVGQYASGFSNPAEGRSIAKKQISQGADILFQVAADTGAAYLKAAGAKGVYGIGVDADQSYLGPYIITSAVKRVDVAVQRAINDTRTGKFHGGDLLLGAREAAVGFAPPAEVVPAAIVAKARSYERQLARGTITPPTSIPAR